MTGNCIIPIYNDERVECISPSSVSYMLNISEYTMLRAEIRRKKEEGWAIKIENEVCPINVDGMHGKASSIFKDFDDALMYSAFGY